MRYLILLVLLSGCTATPYIKTGVKYNFNENNINWNSGIETSKTQNIDCLFELGVETQDGYTVSYQHSSKCLKGAPFNNEDEYVTDGVYFGKYWRF